LLATSHALEGWGDQEVLAVESSAEDCFLLPPRQLQPAYGLDCAYDLPFGRIPTDKTVIRKLTRYASFFSRLYLSNFSRNRSISFFCK